MSDRKRAIETLKQLRLDYEEFYEEHNNEVTQAYDMAIASLETDEAYQLEYERTTKNDLGVDAISRDEVCRYVAEFVNHEFSTREEEELIDNIITGIEHMPSVTPQEPRWIPVTEDAPPKGTICLWCNKQGSVFTSEITYRSECSSHVGKHGYFSNGLENYGNIVAWMPLPTPYEPQESEG